MHRYFAMGREGQCSHQIYCLNYYYWMSVSERYMSVSYGTCVEVRGQLCVVSSFFPLWRLRSKLKSPGSWGKKVFNLLSHLSGSCSHIFDSLYNLEDFKKYFRNLLLGTWYSPKVCRRRHLIRDQCFDLSDMF